MIYSPTKVGEAGTLYKKIVCENNDLQYLRIIYNEDMNDL